MIAPSDVTGVIVTRGDVDLAPSVEALAALGSVVVWDNSREADLAVYGRYAALERVTSDVALVVDDDVLLPRESVEALCAAYRPGVAVCNMPRRFREIGFYPDHALVGFGAIFDRDLPERAFDRYHIWDAATNPRPWLRSNPDALRMSRKYGLGGTREFGGVIEALHSGVDPWAQWFFYRTCDIVFTGLTARELVDLPYADREFASDSNRMYRQASHVGERQRMLDLVRQVRDAK